MQNHLQLSALRQSIEAISQMRSMVCELSNDALLRGSVNGYESLMLAVQCAQLSGLFAAFAKPKDIDSLPESAREVLTLAKPMLDSMLSAGNASSAVAEWFGENHGVDRKILMDDGGVVHVDGKTRGGEPAQEEDATGAPPTHRTPDAVTKAMNLVTGTFGNGPANLN